MAAPEEMSRDELILLVGEQAGRIADLVEANAELVAKLARVEHLLSRNSLNSSSPPSKDDDPGKTAPRQTPKRRGGGPKRKRGKQPGAPGSHLAWTDAPDERADRFPGVPATAAMTWLPRRIWAWSTAASSTKSRGSA